MKYLYFYDSDNNIAGFPANSLIDMRYGDDATEIELFFEGNAGMDSAFKVSLAITSGKVDDVNNQYIMSEITGVNDVTLFA